MDKYIGCKSLQLMVLCILSSIIYQVAGKCLGTSSLAINTFEKVIFQRAKLDCDSYGFMGLLDENCIENINVQMELKQLYMTEGFASLDIWIKGCKTCTIVTIMRNGTSVHHVNCNEKAYTACKTRTDSTGTMHSTYNDLKSVKTVSLESNGALSIRTIVIAFNIITLSLFVIATWLVKKRKQQMVKHCHEGTTSNQTAYSEDTTVYNFSGLDTELHYEYITVESEKGRRATYENHNPYDVSDRDGSILKMESHTYGNSPNISPKINNTKCAPKLKLKPHVNGNSPHNNPYFNIQIRPDRNDYQPYIRPHPSRTIADIHGSKSHHKIHVPLALLEHMYTNTTLE